MSMLITGYMVKNAQDRMDLSRTLSKSDLLQKAETHKVKVMCPFKK